MVKPEWGIKRICQSCNARFYDMRRSPIVCPVCGTEFMPVKSGRGSRPKLVTPAPESIKTEIMEPNNSMELEADEGDTLDDPALDILVEDDGNQDETIEDVSDLENDQNMLDVIDNSEGNPGDTEN
ncbi:MAG: TIGR02300 family protein [Rhodospirillales bacterium]|nr:TIGR02300 family protein [Rhodospirillales bacterium]|tara:strand:- start:1388 stop:1765 length:378 start_codon:yes stop_codon:yes gene_type:complete